MSNDLVKRLREYAQVAHMAAAWGFAGEGLVMEKAADRIEELEKRNASLEAKLSESEALLAKAVEALGVLADDTNWFDAVEEDGTFSPAWRGTGTPDEIARTTLAELSSVSCANTTGGKDE